MEGASIRGSGFALTCSSWRRDRRLRTRGLTRSCPQSKWRRQRVRAASRDAAEQAAATSSRAARERRRDSRSIRSRRRAVKHGAVGGRMTARWSGVYHERRPDRPGSWRISKRSAGGFPTALGGESPKRVFSRRVLVSETSVVETDSKHRGGASKESREASRGAHRRATGRREARTGPIVIHFAQRCDGSKDAERRKASPRLMRPTNSWSLDRASMAGPPAVD